jgi:membrane peptidoglycan carboxypeptidase
VGSTFKPIVYLAAYEKGLDPNGVPYGPGHPADDAPWTLTYDQGKQTWTPRNYEKEFLGWITFRTALAHSVNTVAAKLGVEVGLDRVVETARRLGIESELPEVPSLSLGVAELSPVELLNAYSAIADHGVLHELTVIRALHAENGDFIAQFVDEPRQAVDPGAADLIADQMVNVFTEGTASSAARMGFDRAAAGKTGTTSHHRDAWFGGFTPQLTAVVWVGMDKSPAQATREGKARIKLTGGGSALPVWVRFMKEALTGEPPMLFPLSDKLTQARIDRKSGKLATDSCPDEQTAIEKYVAGHEPHETTCEADWPPTVERSEL